MLNFTIFVDDSIVWFCIVFPSLFQVLCGFADLAVVVVDVDVDVGVVVVVVDVDVSVLVAAVVVNSNLF